MDYQQSLNYIHSLPRFGKKPGFDRIRGLLEYMNCDHTKTQYLHVAGTNGKGSTTTMCHNALTAAGYKTGLFISPFIIDFRERMQICGKMIGEDVLTAYVERTVPYITSLAEGESLTEFEYVTAIALCWFIEQKCDIVCMEVGIGGRLDSTNLITTTLVSVITALGLDHTDLLGDTIDKIAFEKCGIMKEGRTTVCYPIQEDPALEVVFASAAKMNNKLILPNLSAVQMNSENIENPDFSYGPLSFRLSLPGRHQVYNAITAAEALMALRPYGFRITDKNIMQGISNTKFPARLEHLHSSPDIYLDGAHNMNGITALYHAVKDLHPKRLITVMGMMADKDFRDAVEAISEISDHIYAVLPDNPRAVSPDIIAEIAGRHCSAETAASPRDGLMMALKEASPEDMILICGSLYLASELRPVLLNEI